MSRATKIVRIVSVGMGGLSLLLLAGLYGAALEADAKLDRHIAAHSISLAVPTPLTEAERSELRLQHAKATGRGETLDEPALEAIALERAVARGKHLVEARYGCNACHGADLAGGVMLNDPAIGNIRGPNLTRGKGGVPANYGMADWDRIVRHGIRRDGKPALMPSQDYFVMSDQELSDIVSYVRSLPPVDAEVQAPSLGPIGKVLLAVGKFPLSVDKLADHHHAHERAAPAAGDTIEFGAHLAATCTGCHRENLAGGPMPFGPPDWPSAANLTRHTTGLGRWSFEDFERALTEGIAKDGRALGEPMTHVLPGTRAMTPTERKALWRYLSALPARGTNI